MSSMPTSLRAVLLGTAVGVLVGSVVPSYQEIWPEPRPAKDPFYYVDYEKSDAYHRRVRNSQLWPWAVGLAAGVPAGLVYYWVGRPRSSNQV